MKAITLVLALFLMLPAMVSAATYKDVDTNHWAYEYITKLSNDHVINGYPDGKYQPNNDVAYLEVLKLLHGVMNFSSEELSKARVAHNADAVGAGVPNWAQDSVAGALYRGIITTSNLNDAKNASMISNNPVHVPDRQTIAVYFAKALGMSESTDYTVLKHKDINEIPEANKKYLVPLVKAGIFDPTGSDGNFEGRRGIKRAEMAKITYLAYEYVKKYGLELTVEGKVLIEPKESTKVLLIEKKDGNVEPFGFDKDTKYSLNGKEAKIEDVKEGQEVKVTYVKTDTHQSGKLAKKVEIKTDEIPAIGYVQSIFDKGLEVNYAENVTDVRYDTTDSVKVDKKGIFILGKDAKITRYDKEIELKDVKVNDLLEFTLKDNQITSIKVVPQNFEITGELVKIDDRKETDKYAAITLKLSDKKEHVFYVEKITGYQGYTGQKYMVKDLENAKLGENVTFTLKYKIIDKLGTDLKTDSLLGTIPILYTKNNYYTSADNSITTIDSRDIEQIQFISQDKKVNKVFKLAHNYIVEGSKANLTVKDVGNNLVQLTLNNYGEVNKIYIYGDKEIPVTGELIVTGIGKSTESPNEVAIDFKILWSPEHSLINKDFSYNIDGSLANNYEYGAKYRFEGVYNSTKLELLKLIKI